MKRTAAAALTLVLALSQVACTSTLGVLKATFHPDTVAALRLPETERRCVEELFAATHTALVAYEADRTLDKWAAVRNAAAQFDVRQCSSNADFVTVVKLGQRILASVEAPRARGEGVASAEPDFERVDKTAVKELERRVKELKRK